MKLYIARHGQTNYNEARRCNADPSVDVYLTETGIAQAKRLAEELKEADFQHIIVSELKRTRQTAEYVNRYHGAEISVDPRLNDNQSGFEGRLVNEYYDALDKAPNKWEARLNGGESVADVKQRVAAFLDDLKKQPYDAVLVVTSMIIIQLLYATLDDLSFEEAWDLKVERGSCSIREL